MKKLKNILWVLGVLSIAMACEEEFDSEGITVGTIRYPAIQIEGDAVVITQQGGAYTDAGAAASLGTDDITSEVETTTDLDLSAPGVYTVNYTVTTVNELEQESTVTSQRIVVVAPSNPNTTVDLSGAYARNTNAAPVVWTKVAPGVYRNDNIGGLVAPNPGILSVFVFHYADGTITIPAQQTQPIVNGYGILSADITLLPTGYSVVIDNIGFLTNTRTFVKQ